MTEFSELLTKNEIIFYDYKSIKKLLKNYDIEGNCSFDVMIAEFLITQNSTDNLSKIADRYGYELSAYALLKIKEKEKEKLSELGLDKVFYDIEMPLIDILYDMEETGFRIDKKILDEFSIEFNEEILEITEKIYELAGYSFNINSTKQLSELLFDKLGLKPGKKTKSGLSSDKEVLIKLVDKHPIIPLILRYRQITKLQSTYIDGIRNLISKKGRVHTSFKQAFVSTGRLSSTEPNLQNIPIRNSEGARLRKMFIASEGNELVAADYSQIELRLLAHLSEDEKLISAFNSNVDIHAKTASEVFNVDLDMVTDEMRRSAKAVNFGIIYGISNYGLSENLKISPQTAKKFIEDYFEKYPKVRTYMENNVKFAKEKGYAKSMFGRIRYLPEIKSSNYNIRSFNERIAMNMPLQGTAADIIKIAMIDTVKELNKHNLKAKLILQVHDELIIDTPKEEVEEVKKILKNCMEHVAELKVPLAVNIGVSSNWLEAK